MGTVTSYEEAFKTFFRTSRGHGTGQKNLGIILLSPTDTFPKLTSEGERGAHRFSNLRHGPGFAKDMKWG